MEELQEAITRAFDKDAEFRALAPGGLKLAVPDEPRLPFVHLAIGASESDYISDRTVEFEEFTATFTAFAAEHEAGKAIKLMRALGRKDVVTNEYWFEGLSLPTHRVMSVRIMGRQPMVVAFKGARAAAVELLYRVQVQRKAG